MISPDGKITFREETINPNQPIAETAEQTRVQASLDRSRGISQNPDIVNRVRGIQDSVRSPFSETPLPTTPEGRTLNPQLQETYQLLIAPIADLLPQDPNQKVIFIPHRELFEIPFAALQDKEGTYLIEKHTILTSPSIALLDLTRQNRQQKQPSNESVIVGYPEMPTQFELLQPFIERDDIKNTLEEAQTIAKKYNTQAIIGKEATETLIKQKMPNAKLIHLASHGLLNTIKYQEIVNLPDKLSKIPGAIALTPSDQDDGLLTASEIIDMKLNADLVVLSACETGRGDITGEGVNGLSRAFLRAGASNLVISLWKVPDDTTLDLMLEFYQQLETTPDKAIALRQAMLNTMKKHPEPRHWGGFTLTGAANPKN
ncbi:COG0457: FOG: TPR repeat [Crocosphaera watsonii WH 0402]|uniref:COG0457: FOG: TPR repeat n=1 Tax=Crocosphaera watsonii WH 0402 TaxID=1284629 RepID=T2JIZ8_CROWT|nr:COG0457: FOG: TPR repeat [Crocosphaera watsonii WH 0402]